MQRVTYINLYGEAVVFGNEAPLILASVSGFSRSSGKLITSQGAYQNGQTIYRAQLAAKKPTVQFSIYGCGTRQEMYEKRAWLERVLAYDRCVRDGKCGQLVYENDAGAWVMNAVPDGAITYGKRFLNALTGCKVAFTASGAYLKARNAKGKTLRMGSGGFKLPSALPIRLGTRLFDGEIMNEGAADAPMEITIYGTGETPKLVNHTTGAQLIVGTPIATGSKFEINTDPDELSCVLVAPDGTETDAFGYLDPAVAVSAFLLAPGVNRIEYIPSVPSKGSRVDIAWRTLVEGV